jgi:uncharacterized heparinase superfamily protein
MPYFSLLLYTRTLFYLKPKQVMYRGWYALQGRGFPCITPKAKPLPKNLEWKHLKPHATFLSYPWFEAAEIARKDFNFLNEKHRFIEQIDWQIKERSRLWRYNLHYFQYLHTNDGLDQKEAIPLIWEWIKNNAPGSKDAWDPFPISLRIVNWLKYMSKTEIRNEEAEEIINSIYHQCLWLERSLEYHLLANHLFKNAKALVFSGLFFKGRDAHRWLSKGIQLLTRELDEQILTDGGHFERSPMYHSMILEDCLDLLNVCDARTEWQVKKFSKRLRTVARNMVRFLAGLTHPDGKIAIFNDAAFGIEAQPSDLTAYYERVSGEDAPDLNSYPFSFPDTGYFVIGPKPGNRMLIDCGPIGPDYQTGHSHCDTLSFELSLKGRRVVVDSGCFGYEKNPIRDYNRGNAGHNVLTIDGKNQSEVWSSHRCARRAKPLYGRIIKRLDGMIKFEGAHDGYCRLNGSPIHHRKISWSNNTYFIQDKVKGKGQHDIESHIHIHPALNVDTLAEKIVIRDKLDILAHISSLKEDRIEKQEGWYCPEFGKKEKCVVLKTSHEKLSLPYEGGWKIRVIT